MFEIRRILGAPRSGARIPAGARVKRRAWLTLGALALLAQAGCGQKGPLYLPDGRTSTAPPPDTVNTTIRR
ncbi:MAG: Prokaryotic lipoprotein-attachment site [Pseudomonadota bacterium]|jgi:predicted small lipoprotein YifL